jgi:predicted AlkP superfamily pyrophosphatase or phosphodiesterase
MRKLLVVQAAGLGFDLLRKHDLAAVGGLSFRAMPAPFPGLTCPAQATIRTGLPPGRHGVPANGLWFGDLRRPLFWEQSCRLVEGPRVWDDLRRRGGRVAILFWQQSLGENADMLLSPMPVHKHHGGMIESMYSRPAGLYDDICAVVGRQFKLARYWGPMASPAASRWIAEATAAVMRGREAPDLCLTYLPALDYDLQRHGPEGRDAERALGGLMGDIGILLDAAKDGWEVLIFGDYAIGSVEPGGVIYPNLSLGQAGWFRTRSVRGMLYPDFHASAAFAVVDHELAFVHVDDDSLARDVAGNLAKMRGVARVMQAPELEAAGLKHARGGSLLAVAKPGHWFAYPWWEPHEKGPDYAAHVDIHNKPGYDPAELFWGWPPFTVSRSPGRIRGSHGRAGDDRCVAWAATPGLGVVEADSLEGIAAWLRGWCGSA